MLSNEEKLKMLSMIQEDFGPYKIFYMKSKDTPGWKTWKDFSICSDDEKLQSNLRTILDTEVVLDQDNGGLSVLDKLMRWGFSFAEFSTGSRGPHFHLFFPELKGFDVETRIMIKEEIIKFFECDTSKKTGLIAIEHCPHFKTGKEKKLVHIEGSGYNNIPQFILEKIKTRKEIKRNIEKPFVAENPQVEAWIKNDQVLRYILNTPIDEIPDGIEKDIVLFRNLAIMLAKIDDIEKRDELIERLSYQTVHPRRELDGWIVKVENGEISEYNKFELNNWIKRNSLPIRLYNGIELFKGNLNLDALKEGLVSFVDYLDLGEKFYERQPFFYDRNKIWWIWNAKVCCWEIVDEIDIMNQIDLVVQKTTFTTRTNIKNEILEALKRVGRKHIPNDLNKAYIQFNKTIIDITTGEQLNSSPEYFVTNPIPWKIGDSEETPTMDRIFQEWVGDGHVKTLYEIIAYSLLPNYPIHRIFCLNGSGLNGKSKYIQLLINFLGKSNCCSTDLDALISSRFESGKLYRKLLCSMGETNLNAMKNTQLLKRLCGEDLIGFEYKNKMPFEGINYAKILIATNSLPMSYDKTIGFYRRWLIIDFPNQFSEAKDILAEIPEIEYNNLARKCIRILSELLRKRQFNKEGSIDERQARYEELSNPILRFINECCNKDVNGLIMFSEFEKQLVMWLRENQYRVMNSIEIGKQLTKEGFERKSRHIKDEDDKETTAKFVIGLSLLV